MLDDSTKQILHNRPVRCVHCGTANDPQTSECSYCGEALMPAAPVTRVLERSPFLMAVENSESNTFDHDCGVIFQFLPSGTCMHSMLATSLILGRSNASSDCCEMFDLSPLNAMRHGVSRRHCQIERCDNYLTVTDLGSKNGTYLNGHLLQPYETHLLSHGDELVLGTLHVILFFQHNMA